MDDLLQEFLTETNESIATLDVELVNLEQNPDHPELIDNIFRLVHTIKGTCGFLGLPRLEAVAHSGENILGKFRDGELTVTPGAVTLILEALDCIKELLGDLERTETEPDGDDSDLIRRLDAFAAGKGSAAVEAPTASAEPADDGAAKSAEAKGAESAIANQNIRVHVDLLENLMTMVSELVLSRNQLLQMVRGLEDSEFTGPLQRLSNITTELQEGVMKTRMQPIGNAWAKLPRIVRDLSVELDKKIDLQMIGQDTELDRQVLELIKDPLTHMVRNSADHGMETPDERRAAGKPETGRIVLNAFHEGGHIIIKISDDGRGINVDKVMAKALESGIATEAELDGMTDQQIQAFIMKAGFSTAENVTSVSGRGVGMDVVRTNIEKIGGTIDLKSETGEGSCFTIKIPLTLAIVSALIVECQGERFAIPQLSVIELVRASTKNSDHRIETINDTPVLRLRDRLMPLVYLDKVIQLERQEQKAATEAEGAEGSRRTESFIVVTQVGNYQFGIVVDRVFDTEEIVVKPAAPILRELTIYSGNTILGDGRVIMILDPNGIAATTGEVTTGESAVEEQGKTTARSGDLSSLLVFRAGGPEPKAVPLALIARLEEIDVDTIENASGRFVVQYRGKLMPLITLDASYKIRESGRQPVLVFADDERTMALAVDEIVDIVEDRLDVELRSTGDGLLGTAVIAGRSTEIIDVGQCLQAAFADCFAASGDTTMRNGRRARVLLVDDSPFFRNLMVPMLQVAGYEVTAADDPEQALHMRETGEDFDIIVSDIEMPGMSGFEFAEACKKDGRWQDTPIVALSSHVAPQDFERGRAAGFTDYVAKSDRDALLNTLSQTIAVSGGAA